MLKKSLEQFYQLIGKNSSLQEKLMATTDQESFVSMAVKLGQQLGYDFTSEEMNQAIATENNQSGSLEQLSDTDLELVAGGVGGPPVDPDPQNTQNHNPAGKFVPGKGKGINNNPNK